MTALAVQPRCDSFRFPSPPRPGPSPVRDGRWLPVYGTIPLPAEPPAARAVSAAEAEMRWDEDPERWDGMS